MTDTTSPRSPTSADQALAARIRAARIAANISQQDLAARIGVSFQQLQKYENGINRLSASRLLLVCEALGTHPGAMLAGLSAPITEPAPSTPPLRPILAALEAHPNVAGYRITTRNGHSLVFKAAPLGRRRGDG